MSKSAYWNHPERGNWRCVRHSCRWICCWWQGVSGDTERQFRWNCRRTRYTPQEWQYHARRSCRSRIAAPFRLTLSQCLPGTTNYDYYFNLRLQIREKRQSKERGKSNGFDFCSRERQTKNRGEVAWFVGLNTICCNVDYWTLSFLYSNKYCTESNVIKPLKLKARI